MKERNVTAEAVAEALIVAGKSHFAEVIPLRAENRKLRTMLRRHQWAAGGYYDDPWCPECGGSKPTHEAHCKLSALLEVR